MLHDVFPELLDGAPAPAHPRVWEVSRFAVDDAHTQGRYGFSTVPQEMLRAVVRFCAAQGIEALVGVTSAAFARMLGGIGFEVQVLGRPRRIGRVQSLAFRLPIDARTAAAVCGATTETATFARAA
jgi:acyl homoserine lactone synthase